MVPGVFPWKRLVPLAKRGGRSTRRPERSSVESGVGYARRDRIRVANGPGGLGGAVSLTAPAFRYVHGVCGGQRRSTPAYLLELLKYHVSVRFK